MNWNAEKIEERIKIIIADVLNLDPSEINEKTSIRTLPSWKGIKHREIIKRLEKEFNVNFSSSEIDTLVNVKIIKSTIFAYFD